jgi:amino acid transporter
MYISILGIGILYLSVQIAVFSVLPWARVASSKFVISDMLLSATTPTVALVGTALILVIAAASLFSVMLGYTRIPYAAAQEGQFFRVFARLHPTQDFPHISLLALAGMSVVFVLILDLTDAIKSIITMRVFTQFIAQACGLVLLRRRIGSGSMPWKMWLYPLPVIATIVLWLWIFSGATTVQKIVGLAAPVLGAVVFLSIARYRNEWPWRQES